MRPLVLLGRGPMFQLTLKQMAQNPQWVGREVLSTEKISQDQDPITHKKILFRKGLKLLKLGKANASSRSKLRLALLPGSIRIPNVTQTLAIPSIERKNCNEW